MQLDLEQIKAAAHAAGGGQWAASDGIVWFDDGDSALTVMNPVPAHIAHDNLGTWPDPIAAEDVAKFSALVCPAAVLELVERLERAEATAAAAEADVRRLDSGVFTITQRNDWGEEFKSEWRGMDLRAMIDEAMAKVRDDEDE